MHTAIKMNIPRTPRSLKQNLIYNQLKYMETISTQKEQNNTSTSTGGATPRPFSEIPRVSFFKNILQTMPGGKYHNLEYAQLLKRYSEDYGRLYVMPGTLSGPPSLITHNPTDFETIYRNEDVWPIRLGLETMHYYRSEYRKDFFKGVEGLIASQGKEWASFRTTVNPIMLLPKNVKLYMHRMANVSKEFVERIREIRDPVTFEVPDTFETELNRFALESVSTVALDKQLGLFKGNINDPLANAMYKNLTIFFEISVEMNLKLSLWRYYATKDFKTLMKALDNIVDVTASYVNEAIERLEEGKSKGIERPEHEQSVLEKLVKIDKQVAIVMAMELFFGGVDSSTSALAGILLCLAKNPDKQAKLREEVRKILPEKDSQFNDHSLDTLPYLRACIKEGLRLYPFVPFNMRVPRKDIVLSGYHIPKGTIILMVFTNILQNENYFQNAKAFIPERWLRGSERYIFDLKPSSPFFHSQFGFGARMCIGKRIFDLELELGLARLIRNFHVEFNYPTENAFQCLMVSLPNIPLKFKFTEVED